MKNITLILGIIILIAVGGGFLYYEKSSQNYVPSGTDQSSTGDFQKVTLSFQNYNYYPNTIKVTAGQSVRIYLDSSIGGCYRSFTIKQLGLAKYLATPNDYLEFTPAEKGSYKFACSMGMGFGTLIVE